MATTPNAAYDYLIKLLIIGDSGVGKSHLLLRFSDDAYPPWIYTIGIDFKIRTVEIDNKRCKLQIWDTAGSERFRTITASYYRGAMGILFVYDITDEQSFANVRNWMRDVQQHASESVSKVLLGTKAEMVDKRKVENSRGQLLADEHQMQFFETSAASNVNVDVAFMTIARDAMHRFTLLNSAPRRSASAITDAIGAALGGNFVAELMAQSSYCLASQRSLQRWEAMFPCRAPSQAFAPQRHVHGIDIGLKQRSALLTRAALSELLVLRLMRFQGAYHVRHPLRHATCVVSRRHSLFSNNWTDVCLQEGQQLYEQQRFSDAVKSWRQAALLQHAASHAFLSDVLYNVPVAFKSAADTVVLQCVFQAKRLTLRFLWYTRRFVLCADGTLHRYDGGQLRHSAAITSTTSVAKLGDAEFTVTFLQPDLRYHIRAASCAERDKWVSTLLDAKAKAVFNANLAHDQSTSTVRPVASLSNPPTGAAVDCTHRKGALGRCRIAGEVAGWFRLAAVQGHADAQFNLGHMFENGQGVARDRAEAARCYREAAAQGHAVAAEALRRFGA